MSLFINICKLLEGAVSRYTYMYFIGFFGANFSHVIESRLTNNQLNTKNYFRKNHWLNLLRGKITCLPKHEKKFAI